MAFDAAQYKNSVLVPLAKDKARLEVLQQVIRDLQGAGGITAAARLNAAELFAVGPGMSAPELGAHLKSLEMTYNKQKNLPSAQLLKKLLDLFGRNRVADPAFWMRLAAEHGRQFAQRLDALARAVSYEHPLKVITPEQVSGWASVCGASANDLAAGLSHNDVQVWPDLELPETRIPAAVRRLTEFSEFRTLVDLVTWPNPATDVEVLDDVHLVENGRAVHPNEFQTARASLRQDPRLGHGVAFAAQAALEAMAELRSSDETRRFVLASVVEMARRALGAGLPRLLVVDDLSSRGVHSRDAARIVAKLSSVGSTEPSTPGHREPSELSEMRDCLASLTERVSNFIEAQSEEQVAPSRTAKPATAPTGPHDEAGQAEAPAGEHSMRPDCVTPAVLGVHLGASYVSVAWINDLDQAEVLLNFDGDRTTPAVVYFESDNNVVVGAEAKRVQLSDPDNACSLIKRHIGTVYPQEFRGQEYTPESISALILKELVKMANSELTQEVSKVVITVPAYFGSKEREATKQAGQIAGLEVVGILAEPVACLLSVGISEEPETLLTFDIGGSTFDVTVLHASRSHIETVAIDGNNMLGGADWDDSLAELIADKFVAQAGLGDESPRLDAEFEIVLLGQAEDMKKFLTKRESATVRCRYQDKDEQVTVTRAEFEAATRHLVAQTLEISQRVVKAAESKVPGLKVDRVLLVGGSSKMPMIDAALREQLGWNPANTDFDLAAAKGAAVYGAMLLDQGGLRGCSCCEDFFGRGEDR